MRKILVVVNVCLIYLVVYLFSSSVVFGKSKTDDTTATVVSKWKKGDTKKLLVKQAKEKITDGKKVKEGSVFEVNMKVLDKAKDGYTIEWTYHIIDIESDNPLMKSLYRMGEGLKVIYKTDELGVFKELVNWKEMKEFLYKGLDRVGKEFKDNDAVKGILKQFKEMYSTRENIETTLDDIQLYHTPYGGEYKLNEIITAETQLPNILGGDPFPARLEIEMTVFEPEKKYCKIVTRQELDKEKASKIIFEFLKKIAAQSGKPIPKDTEIPVITIKDTSEHDIDLEGGWVKRAYFKRLMESGQVRQTDTYEIILKK